MMRKNKLKAELLFTKLNSIFSKKGDLDKFAWFNMMKNLSPGSSKIDNSRVNFKKTQSTNLPNSQEESKGDKNKPVSSQASIWSKVQAMKSSLIEDMLKKEQSNLKNLYPNLDYDSHDYLDSDPEANELDAYLGRRLEKIERSKKYRDALKYGKGADTSIDSKTTSKIVIGEDTEYRYVLESDEGESSDTDSESESEYNESDTPVDRIFSHSFIQQSKGTEKEFSYNDAPQKLQKKKSLKQEINPEDYKKVEKKSSSIKKTEKCIEVEEVKEEGYFHHILDKSEVFSNISAIWDHPNTNNLKNIINFNPAHGISFEDDTEFGKDIKNLHLEEFGGEYTDKIDDDSEEFQIKKKTKVVKKDINEIAKDLEKIRDLVMLNGDKGEGDQEDVANDDEIEDYDEEEEKEYEFGEGEYRMEEDELWEGEESEQESSNALPEYNSREISDFITDI